jgi:DNA-directed RNA polymerase subunit RPC12/RpoP
MSVEGICLECQRTVHLADGDEPVCPVCGSRVMGPQIEEPRLKRIGKNEAAFKAFNQARAKEQGRSILDLVCECGDTTCTEELEMEASEYHPVRSHPTRFVVLPGHEIVDAETVVERAPGYFIVEKRGSAKEGAREAEL